MLKFYILKLSTVVWNCKNIHFYQQNYCNTPHNTWHIGLQNPFFQQLSRFSIKNFGALAPNKVVSPQVNQLLQITFSDLFLNIVFVYDAILITGSLLFYLNGCKGTQLTRDSLCLDFLLLIFLPQGLLLWF